MKVKIKYFDKDVTPLQHISKGDWVDLRVSNIEGAMWDPDRRAWKLYAGEFYKIWTGVGIKLPEGYEAHTAPRGSTFRKHKLLQTNSVGVVDETYCGDNDQWFIPVYAMESTVVGKDDRLFQFRIIEKMPRLEFEEVGVLEAEDRGGDGSTDNPEGPDELVFSISQLITSVKADSEQQLVEGTMDTEEAEDILKMACPSSKRSWQYKLDGLPLKYIREETGYEVEDSWCVPRKDFKPYTK